jgi:hypothetical protein
MGPTVRLRTPGGLYFHPSLVAKQTNAAVERKMRLRLQLHFKGSHFFTDPTSASQQIRFMSDRHRSSTSRMMTKSWNYACLQDGLGNATRTTWSSLICNEVVTSFAPGADLKASKFSITSRLLNVSVQELAYRWVQWRPSMMENSQDNREIWKVQIDWLSALEVTLFDPWLPRAQLPSLGDTSTLM